METKFDSVISEYLNREMSVRIYGHYGVNVLMFPAGGNSSSECEESGAIKAIEHLIKIGKCKVFCISGIDSEIWHNKSLSQKEKSKMHFDFNKFIEEEIVPYIYSQSGGPVPVITSGASAGAFHAANSFFRRPDIFIGTIALSGCYDISTKIIGYYDDNCYYNSPVHYLPNLNDSYWLSFLYSRRHIYLASGSGEGESPDNSRLLSTILQDKGIRHQLEIWGPEHGHNYSTWNAMIQHFIENRL